MDDKIDIHALNQINFERSCAFKHIAELKKLPNTKEVQELRESLFLYAHYCDEMIEWHTKLRFIK